MQTCSMCTCGSRRGSPLVLGCQGIVRLGRSVDEGLRRIRGAGCPHRATWVGDTRWSGWTVCRVNTTLAWSVARLCRRGRPGYTAAAFSAAKRYAWESGGGLVVGGLTMHMFWNNQDFRTSAHGLWSPTHGEARKPGHVCTRDHCPPVALLRSPVPRALSFAL
jgi:hypothetical protein